jgi:hypothetical protein
MGVPANRVAVVAAVERLPAARWPVEQLPAAR